MKIDSERIRFDIKDVERLIAEEKEKYRGISWELSKDAARAMCDHRHWLKPAATVLYAIVAHSRGRVHRHDHDLEKQEKMIQHVLKEYVVAAA